MKRMRAAHPKPRRPAFLPARLRHTRDEPARREFSEGQARNLESANEGAAAAADLATIDHPGGAGIARQLREGQIIFLRFELSPQGRVFFHGRALAFVAINPGRFRHKGTRKVAREPRNANPLCEGASHNGHKGSQRPDFPVFIGRWALGVGRWAFASNMFALKTDTLPSNAADLARCLNESLRDLFHLPNDPVTIREISYPHLASLAVALDGAQLHGHPPPIPSAGSESI